MSIYVRPFEAGDETYIVGGLLESAIAHHPDREKWILRHTEGPAYTGTVNGEIIGCGGVCMYWEGVGEAWASLSPRVTAMRKSVYLCLRECLRIIWTTFAMRRIQAIARCDFEAAQRLLEHLGFVQEATLRRYAPDGVDCFLYAKLES